jgi:hypothetical protein
MKPTSINLAISLFITSLFSLGEMAESLLDGFGLRVEMEFMLYQHPRNSKHVSRLPYKDIPIFLEESRLPYKDIPIFLEEFDERKFLFGVQIIPYLSNLTGLLWG